MKIFFEFLIQEKFFVNLNKHVFLEAKTWTKQFFLEILFVSLYGVKMRKSPLKFKIQEELLCLLPKKSPRIRYFFFKKKKPSKIEFTVPFV